MSEASIEKLCATEKNYVSVGWRTLVLEETSDEIPLPHTAILEMSASILHIWIWCTRWYKAHQVAVWVSAG